jgi:hypothetical protein
MSAAIYWTVADLAELDVSVWNLVTSYMDEHRPNCVRCAGPEPCPQYGAWRTHKAACRACQGDAPLTYTRTDDCRQRHGRFLEHNRRGCVRCLPCPHLQRGIAHVADWRDARHLLSRADALRANSVQPPAERKTT